MYTYTFGIPLRISGQTCGTTTLWSSGYCSFNGNTRMVTFWSTACWLPLDPNNPWKKGGFLHPQKYGLYPLKMKETWVPMATHWFFNRLPELLFVLVVFSAWLFVPSRTTLTLKGHGSRDPRSEEKSKYIDDDGNVIKMPGADYADRGDRNGYKWCYHQFCMFFIFAISTISTTLKDIDMQFFQELCCKPSWTHLTISLLYCEPAAVMFVSRAGPWICLAERAGEDNGVRVLYDGMKWREAFLAWRWHLGEGSKGDTESTLPISVDSSEQGGWGGQKKTNTLLGIRVRRKMFCMLIYAII